MRHNIVFRFTLTLQGKYKKITSFINHISYYSLVDGCGTYG